MPTPQKIRRQRPGIRAEQTTITLPGDEMNRLREEALGKRMTVSMYVVHLIRKAWGIETNEEAA